MNANRGSERKVVNMDVELVAGDHTYTGTIENISADGLYIQFTTEPTKSAKDFLPTSKFNIKLTLPSGENLELACESKWINIYQEPPDDVVNHLGIQIIDPPEKLKEFIETLPSVDMGSLSSEE